MNLKFLKIFDAAPPIEPVDMDSAERLRKSNDAPVITMGARVIGSELAITIVNAWLDSEFLGGGSQPKVDQIVELESQSFTQ